MSDLRSSGDRQGEHRVPPARSAEVRAQEIIFSGAAFSRYRFVQESPILPEIWLSFVKGGFRDTDVEVLITPNSAHGASLLYHWIETVGPAHYGLSRVAANESHVVANLKYGGILALLPLTTWWQRMVSRSSRSIWSMIEQLAHQPARTNQAVAAIHTLLNSARRTDSPDPTASKRAGHVYPALRRVARSLYDDWFSPEDRDDGVIQTLALVLAAGALPCVQYAELVESEPEELAGSIQAVAGMLLHGAIHLTELAGSGTTIDPGVIDKVKKNGLIWSISRNREALHAMKSARLTLKADASERLFGISTADILWAVVDSGIDATHPAFLGKDAGDPGKLSTDQIIAKSRIRQTLDFTRLRHMLSGEALDANKGWFSKLTKIQQTSAQQVLNDSSRLLRMGRMIDWKLLTPLLEVPHTSAAEYSLSSRSSHGTHVAGILGANWRPEAYATGTAPGELANGPILGVCPDIQFLDLRVFDEETGASDEFTILAALQYVRYLNQSRGLMQVLGLNLSLSLWHDVRNYGCGVTPICVECTRLVGSGVVVVAAAGNYGYERTNGDYLWGGAYRGMTVTDPGNAEAVITVGSTHRTNPHEYGISFFSSRGPTGDGRMKPDLVAPGERIVSTIPDRRIDERDGTSMAAPMVSGVAAMMMARHVELRGHPQRIKEILCATATDLGRERAFQGAGLVDALRALQSQ